jgi:putative ABC transport system permease protein
MVPLRLIGRNLLGHPLRSVLTAGSLLVAMFLLCVLRSLVVTLDAGVDQARTDRLVVQSAASLFVTLPENYRGKVAAVDGVKDVCSWTWFGAYYQKRENFFAQFSTDQDTLLAMYPEMEIVEGDYEKFRLNRNSCIIGEALVKSYGFKLGDKVPLIGTFIQRLDGQPWEFEVAAVYRSNAGTLDSGTLFFHHEFLKKAREEKLCTGEEGVNTFVVKVADGIDPIAVASRIDALFENGPQKVQTTTEAEFNAQFVSMIGNIPFFLSALGSGVLFAIVMAVINTMLMAAREQTRAVGIMKALGFTSVTVFLVFLLQSISLALIGGGAGVALALAASDGFRDALGTTFPNYYVSHDTVVLGFIVTALVGVIAGVVPAMKLARLNPVAALRTEQ